MRAVISIPSYVDPRCMQSGVRTDQNQPPVKLAHALIGKALVEIVLVSILVVAFVTSSFPPSFRGWSELNGSELSGWAVDERRPDHRITVQLFLNGQFVANQHANEFRPDVRHSGWAVDDWHGFNFKLDRLKPGFYDARIYALHPSQSGTRQTLQLLGKPIQFQVKDDGSLSQ